MSLGSFLQDRRMDLNLSVLDVAQKTGLSVGSIRAYEQGRRLPTVPSMEKLLSALLITANYWSTPTIWVDPISNEPYYLGRYPGDNQKVRSEKATPNGPSLGLATTEELFRELIARFTVSLSGPGSVQRAIVLAEMLGGLDSHDREYQTATP